LGQSRDEQNICAVTKRDMHGQSPAAPPYSYYLSPPPGGDAEHRNLWISLDVSQYNVKLENSWLTAVTFNTWTPESPETALL